MKYIQGTFYKRPFFNKKGNNTRNANNAKNTNNARNNQLWQRCEPHRQS